VKRIAIVAAAAVAVIVGGALFGRPESPAPTPAAAPADLLKQRIATTQDRLRRVPGDWTAWAGLGLAYLEESRVTGDPTLYPKAEQAVAKSLELRPTGNDGALAARGAIANARHDFPAARLDALAALTGNPYSADAYGVLVDAETQLGHAPEATDAVQHLLDLRPGLSAYARASYDLEQRGLVGPATELMTDALRSAVDGHDIAFCRVQLGDLAFGSGDLTAAGVHYAAGLAADPNSVALLRSQARLDAALGHTDAALHGYDLVTRRAPSASYLLEYADLLRAAGQTARARTETELAAAAHQLFTANGGIDDLAGAQIAIALGRPDDAVRAASAEWQRRQHADVADALAWALHLAGDDRSALSYAEKAVATGARSAAYAYHLGMIQYALGDRAGAVSALGRALELNPYFSPLDAPVARATLTQLGS
jgi:tetratricopeptide (TPR) repeat protein